MATCPPAISSFKTSYTESKEKYRWVGEDWRRELGEGLVIEMLPYPILLHKVGCNLSHSFSSITVGQYKHIFSGFHVLVLKKIKVLFIIFPLLSILKY